MTTAELTCPPEPMVAGEPASETVSSPEQRPSPHPQTTSATTLLLIAAWLGCVTGGMEGISWAFYQWRNAGMVFMHPGYVWISPATQMFLCLAAGLLPAVYCWFRPSPRVFTASIWLVALLAWFNQVQLWIPGLQVWAWFLLSCGLATATRRMYAARTPACRRVVALTLPWMCAAIILTAVVQFGWSAKQEADAVNALPPAPEKAPNVLLIVLDTVRADALQDATLTPNIANYAARGVQFTQAKSTAPWTLPSQSGMFTARLPHELSSDWWSRLDASFPTLAEVLSQQGWNTGGFVGNTRYCSRETGIHRGFTHYEGYRLSPSDCLLTTAIGRKLLLSPLPTYVGILDWPGRKRAAEINRSFLDWMESQGDRPFFAFLNYFDAHDPYLAPAEFQTQTPPTGEDMMLLRDWWWAHKDTLTARQVEILQTAYEDCIRGLDQQVGQLLDELDDRGVLEHTVVLITADHGEHFGDHELYLHGNSLYESALNVPLQIIGPGGVPEGVRIHQPVSLRGLPNTVLELLGIPKAAEFPGLAWTHLWKDPASDTGLGNRPGSEDATESSVAMAVYSEIASQAGFPPCHGRSPVASGPMQCVQWGRWKFIRDALGTEQLFDLSADPEEAKDLAKDGRFEDQVQTMRGLLRAKNPEGALSPWPTIPELTP